jgi:hypothetical protein
MITVQIELPEQLAQQAQSAGLFFSQKMEAILRAQLRREAFEGLRTLHEKLPRKEITPQIAQEIDAAVRAVRAQRRQGRAD